MNAETVPVGFARSLLSLVVKRDCDYSPMLAKAGIDFDPMQPTSLGCQQRIDAMQYSKLYRQVAGLFCNEAIGFGFGHNVTPGAFRMMCYCILSCETLGSAIKRICEFYRIFFQASVQISIDSFSKHTAVGYIKPALEKNNAMVDTTDVYSLRLWHCFFCWLTGRSIKLLEVRFRGCSPAHQGKRQKYTQLFNCTIHYKCAHEQIVFDSDYLRSPLVHTERSLKEFLRTAPYQLMMIDTDSTRQSLSTRVRSMIGHDFSQGLPSFEKITKMLNMSAPTLRRRLKREGVTYQQLKDECRRDASMEYLSNPNLSISTIAALMGFTDPSAFHRSFKKWTAMTPGQYRAAELELA